MAAVKPLVWECWSWDDEDPGVWQARTEFGRVVVGQSVDRVMWVWTTSTFTKRGYPTLDAAKADAQAWWEEAVLKCLDLNLHLGNVQ